MSNLNIGLDISTTAIGLVALDEEKKIVKQNVFNKDNKVNIKERMKQLFYEVNNYVEKEFSNYKIDNFIISKAFNQHMNKYISILEGMISSIGFKFNANVEWSNDSEWYTHIKRNNSLTDSLEKQLKTKFGNKSGRIIKKTLTINDYCSQNNIEIQSLKYDQAPSKIYAITNKGNIYDDEADAWAVIFYLDSVKMSKVINLEKSNDIKKRNKLRKENKKLKIQIHNNELKIKDLEITKKEHESKYLTTSDKRYESWYHSTEDKIKSVRELIKQLETQIIQNNVIIKGEKNE